MKPYTLVKLALLGTVAALLYAAVQLILRVGPSIILIGSVIVFYSLGLLFTSLISSRVRGTYGDRVSYLLVNLTGMFANLGSAIHSPYNWIGVALWAGLSVLAFIFVRKSVRNLQLTPEQVLHKDSFDLRTI